MGRFREQIRITDVSVAFVTEQIVKNMQCNDYGLIAYYGQGVWMKRFHNPGRIGPVKSVRVHFAFFLDENYLVMEAFVVWPMFLTMDSGEYGLERGMIGWSQKKVLREQVNLVRGFVHSLMP